MELVVRLHRVLPTRGQKCQIDFIPDTVCWTEAPESARTLWRQRNRWQRGLGQALSRHTALLFNPRYGVIGLLAVPYFWGVEFLSPVLETAGLVVFAYAAMTSTIDWEAMKSFLLVTVLMGVNFSLFAVLLEEFTLHRYARVDDLLRLASGAVLEHLGYRQMLNLARVDGTIDFLRNIGTWGSLEKKGLQSD